MPPPEPPSLWDLTAAAPLAGRFLLDEHTRVTLDVIDGATRFAGQRARLRGASVVLLAGSQLATALALLELDGLARRIVLCPPDLAPRHLPGVIATTEASAVVCDRAPPELAGAGVACIVAGPAVADAGRGDGARCATEWALFTSGTTGPPRLALHSLHSLTGAISPGAIGRPATAAGGGVWSTFYDIRRYGGLQILLRALLGGGSMVLSGADEPVGDFLERARGAGVTFMSGTPTHWRRAVLSPAAAALAPADVRLSGEVADQAILDKLRAVYPAARIAHAFASTEAGVAFDIADGLAGFPADLVGRAGGAVELRVVEETLRIRSPRTASRYLGAEAAPLADAEGFVDTKDLLERRGDRWYFAGRRDGVINVGGLKVHPEEVEAVINRHPGVEMSLVKARRSPIIGAIVVAEIVLTAAAAAGDPKTLEADILATCREALAWYKVPAAVRIVPSLAVTAAGKLTRARV